jgi:hypothetical protein
MHGQLGAARPKQVVVHRAQVGYERHLRQRPAQELRADQRLHLGVIEQGGVVGIHQLDHDARLARLARKTGAQDLATDDAARVGLGARLEAVAAHQQHGVEVRRRAGLEYLGHRVVGEHVIEL